MLATVRNRRGVVVAVEPFDGEAGRMHLVHLEYKDNYTPTSERLLWEREPKGSLLEPTELPNPSRDDAMDPNDFDALVRAARWTALSPYISPNGNGRTGWEPVSSPFHGGVQIEDYQLVPLLRALRMPRVNLLIADDVGLGKTVEAGLILTELILRRRIRRILVLVPASLRQQWIDELWEKFSLRFEIVGRHETERFRKRFGMDVNPWRSFDRIVASYHYLRQDDVLERFLSACQTPENSPHLPWDLLIVDECHNLMPPPFGPDSQLCRALKLIAPRFEHRLFLSATPHNGHTRSFTGLLEMLDPVRFTRTNEMNLSMRGRINDIVIRRLKRDINDTTESPRFCTRHLAPAIELEPESRELALSKAFDEFRRAVHELVRDSTKQRRRAGTFAVEILGKRLLSAPVAFAESWRRAKQGLAEPQAAMEKEVTTARRVLRQETDDDREIEQREATAAAVTGAWLKNFADEVKHKILGIETALDALGFDLEGQPVVDQTPRSDVRFDSLVKLIDQLLRDDSESREGGTEATDGFRDDDRLIVFTEYKTTLDYLARRLRERYRSDRILTLFGGSGSEGMDQNDREYVKDAFNDPCSTVRVLVATDAASEGLNLHCTARYLLHFDCPWNPSRLEQRNGRIDRYGQARDVTVHHFVSEDDPDLRFLGHVIRKANEIRDDLGSLNEIFDRAIHRRLIRGEDPGVVQQDMEQSIPQALRRAAIGEDIPVRPQHTPSEEAAVLESMATEIDLDERALGRTLEAAMATSGGRPQLRESTESGLFRLLNPDLVGWRDIIDSAIRDESTGGAIPQLAFGATPFIQRHGGMRVFRPRQDALLIHLGHPMMHRALSVLARRRYPGEQQVSRWIVRHGNVPADADALVLLSLEEIAVNELRETFHRWVRTVAFPVRDGELAEPMEHEPARFYGDVRCAGASTAKKVGGGEFLEDVSEDLKRWLRKYKRQLTALLRSELDQDGKATREREDQRYRSRRGEVSELIEQSTLAKLTAEIETLKRRVNQGELFDDAGHLADVERSIQEKQAEINRRRSHYNEIRDQLQSERRRTIEFLLPKRFAMSGDAQVFPVAVEIRLPE